MSELRCVILPIKSLNSFIQAVLLLDQGLRACLGASELSMLLIHLLQTKLASDAHLLGP